MIDGRRRFPASPAVTDSAGSTPVSQLLAQAGQGDPQSLDRLFPLVYRELHKLAQRCIRSRRPGVTMQTTALINEAYIRLVGGSSSWNDRVHFLAIAARAMRAILVDTIRAQGRDKRGGGLLRITLNEDLLPGDHDETLLALDEALQQLAAFDPRKSRVVELHYFGGLTWDEIAAELKISVATVHRDMRLAEAWLAKRLKAGG